MAILITKGLQINKASESPIYRLSENKFQMPKNWFNDVVLY